MRYFFHAESDPDKSLDTQYITCSTGAPPLRKPPSAADLKQEAARAIAAWQKALTAETNQEEALNKALLQMATEIKDKAEAAQLDAAIREEWKKTHAVI